MPETGCRVDWDSGERALSFGHVDGSELVSTSRVVLEINRKDWHGELRHDAVEESGLLGWLDGVQLAESETDETVVVGVLGERLGDGGGKLHCLSGCGGTTNVDNIHTDSSSGSRSITVGDRPCCSLHYLERFALCWIECTVLSNGLLGKSTAKDPPSKMLVYGISLM